ncbi:hypothetical protein F441_15104 [Phytophthora nicotianae CJ01A1]|uniref:Uncharacterized protein n=1 Tax=Phytophthora nicotianae CJ01A1 TaxID=1317063 RepID=W2WEF8_PHYNI|nr:hypothetical protein F441_15104 [Phytophthora nicotianae CJ01A1]
MAVPPASAAAASPASAAPSPRSPTVQPVVLPNDSLLAPPAGMASPASSDPHTSDEELLASFLDWGPDSDFGSRSRARSRARSSTPPAPAAVPSVSAAMVDASAVAVTPPSPVRDPVAPSSPVRAPVAPSPSDAAAEVPTSRLVPPRLVTPPVSSAETASATTLDTSASPPPTVLQQLIYEVSIEGLCGDDVGGDDSVAAEDVPLQAVGLFNDEDEEDIQRSKRARLCRGDETSDWHPFPLPKAPEGHPTTNHRNHYNLDAPWDYANSAGITCLLDVEGE